MWIENWDFKNFLCQSKAETVALLTQRFLQQKQELDQ